MKNPLPPEVESHRTAWPKHSPNGHFFFRHESATLSVRVSDGGGWDHVSVSLKTRCPSWAEMDYIYRQFFADGEWAMQLHPPGASKINNNPFCLHLWRPQSAEEIAQIKAEWEAAGEEYPAGIESPGSIPIPPPKFV